VRCPEEGENVEITVVSIICAAAKGAGKQYSKRMLPPFVIPYCQIGREGVLAYLRRYPDGEFVYAAGLQMMGARDKRTIRRHIALGLQTLGAAALALANLLSELAAFATLPQPGLRDSPGQSLQQLSEQIERAARRARGGRASQIPAIVYAHLASVWERSPQPPAAPLTHVLRVVVLHDTS
jgi:hypothetical protein